MPPTINIGSKNLGFLKTNNKIKIGLHSIKYRNNGGHQPPNQSISRNHLAGKRVSMEDQYIKDYCIEALDISVKNGMRDALAFLFEEKFCPKYSSFKKIQNKLKYLYPDDTPDGSNPLLLGGSSLNMSYAITLNENYQEMLEQFKYLNYSLMVFIREINSAFTKNDVLEYLNSYPRMKFKQQSVIYDELEPETDSFLSISDLVAEAEDVLFIEDIKKLFQ